jgi:hypothetical protein
MKRKRGYREARQSAGHEHLYRNHSMDSLRWNSFTSRTGDVVVATSYKAGTTWVQVIVANLIFSGKDLPGSINEMAPWLDFRPMPLELVLSELEQQNHRRSLKTHLHDRIRPARGCAYVPCNATTLKIGGFEVKLTSSRDDEGGLAKGY